MGINDLEQLSLNIRNTYEVEQNWRRVAARFDINPGLAYKIGVQGYDPKTPHLRVKLGLPALAPAPVCRDCGDVHITGFCTVGLTGIAPAPVCPVCGEVHTVDFCAKDATLAPAPVCPKCGQVHISHRCTNGAKKARPPRLAIRLDSPESAALSIIKHMEPEHIAELIDLLTEL